MSAVFRYLVVGVMMVPMAGLSSCSSKDGGDDSVTTDSPSPSPSPSPDVEAASTTIAAAAAPTTAASNEPELETPLFGSFDQAIGILTATSGAGSRPTLEWTPVDGADHYGVYLYAPDGSIYWAWRGDSTSISVGGEPLLTDTASGPRVAAGMTWAVVAYDADLLPLAVSPASEIAP